MQKQQTAGIGIPRPALSVAASQRETSLVADRIVATEVRTEQRSERVNRFHVFGWPLFGCEKSEAYPFVPFFSGLRRTQSARSPYPIAPPNSDSALAPGETAEEKLKIGFGPFDVRVRAAQCREQSQRITGGKDMPFRSFRLGRPR